MALSSSSAPGGNYRDGHGRQTVHYWEDTFKGQRAEFRCTSVRGHVFDCDFPENFNNWNAVDPAHLYQAPTKRKITKGGYDVVKNLESAAAGCDYLILWLDCDREGENICFEVMDVVRKSMKYMRENDNVYRAHFSSLTPQSIREAAKLGNLRRPDRNQSEAVEARQILDLRIGCSFTRFQSMHFQSKYADLDAGTVSYGPCQTPTLGFCVRRHDEIMQFKPETFYVIQPIISRNGKKYPITWERGRVFREQVGRMFHELVKSGGDGYVSKVQQKNQSKKRPHGLNTVDMLQVASKALGIGPGETMHIAERLYLEGIISYPRTESTAYDKTFDPIPLIKNMASGSNWRQEAAYVLDGNFRRNNAGKNMGDHPPITPVRVASPGGAAGRIYDMIVRHFLASFAPDCEYTVMTYTIKIATEIFYGEGVEVVELGFTSIQKHKQMEDYGFPLLNEGQTVGVNNVEFHTRKTKPPDYLAESELIKMMESNGIGTDASIPVHVEKIKTRNYCEVKPPGRRMVPTNLGIVLVHGYHMIDPDLSASKLRAGMENAMTKIAEGHAQRDHVIDWMSELFRQKFIYFRDRAEKMELLFGAHFHLIENVTGNRMARCGKCCRYMIYLEQRPRRLHCKTCDETYPLPMIGTIKQYMERTCPICDFELLRWTHSYKAGKVGYVFCPNCYNNPPKEFNIEDVKARGGMGCNKCHHPTCENSAKVNLVKPNPKNRGYFVLDQGSKPKWKVQSSDMFNRIEIYFVAEKAKKVTVVHEPCRKCRANQLKVEFDNANNPLKSGNKHTGCMFCDETMKSLVKFRDGDVVAHITRSKRGGRGRGKGDGKRGGRGGGKRGGRGGRGGRRR